MPRVIQFSKYCYNFDYVHSIIHISILHILTDIVAEPNFRAGIMYADASMDGEAGGQQLRSNMFSLSGTGFFGAVGRSINLGKRPVSCVLINSFMCR